MKVLGTDPGTRSHLNRLVFRVIDLDFGSPQSSFQIPDLPNIEEHDKFQSAGTKPVHQRYVSQRSIILFVFRGRWPRC